MVNTMIFVLGMVAGAAVYWIVGAALYWLAGAIHELPLPDSNAHDEHEDIDGNGWGEK